MKSFLTDSVFLGVVVSLLTYEFGLWFKKKVKIAILKPLLIYLIEVMVFLVVFHIDYADYQDKNLWLFQKRSCNTKSLLLSA